MRSDYTMDGAKIISISILQKVNSYRYECLMDIKISNEIHFKLNIYESDMK
jgi:hypothetical protein